MFLGFRPGFIGYKGSETSLPEMSAPFFAEVHAAGEASMSFADSTPDIGGRHTKYAVG